MQRLSRRTCVNSKVQRSKGIWGEKWARKKCVIALRMVPIKRWKELGWGVASGRASLWIYRHQTQPRGRRLHHFGLRRTSCFNRQSDGDFANSKFDLNQALNLSDQLHRSPSLAQAVTFRYLREVITSVRRSESHVESPGHSQADLNNSSGSPSSRPLSSPQYCRPAVTNKRRMAEFEWFLGVRTSG